MAPLFFCPPAASEKQIAPQSAQRGRTATETRNISRKDAKAAKVGERTWRTLRLGASQFPCCEEHEVDIGMG
jgi:hypothetical protein